MQRAILQEHNQATNWIRAFLSCGIVAGPLHAIVGLMQAFTRPGFDITRHTLSLLEKGGFRATHYVTR